MINLLLSALFPPKLGKIEGLDDVLRLQAIESGALKVQRPDNLPETGIVSVFEWPYGREHAPRKIR